MTISAKLVKDLRTKTGAAMMTCKKALQESNGDFEAALDWLKKKGAAIAAKKSGRTAAEGLVAAVVDSKAGVVIELNAETDFVARNNNFQSLVSNIAAAYLGNSNLDFEALKQLTLESGRSVADEITHAIATIGENMNLRRTAAVKVNKGVVCSYIHNKVSNHAGKIAVLIGLESEAPTDKLQQLGHKIAMHIAASKPDSLSVDDLDANQVARERSIFSEQAKESGKPENIIEKMVEGRMRKYYEEVVLLKQKFVMDPDQSIEKLVENSSKQLGADIKIADFKLFILGDGIEQEQADFASEVSSIASSA
ncbi:MAG: translation elongation factor Ts [Pseudomonadota bacterium]